MLKKTQSKFPKVLQEWLGHRKIEEIVKEFIVNVLLSFPEESVTFIVQFE